MTKKEKKLISVSVRNTIRQLAETKGGKITTIEVAKRISNCDFPGMSPERIAGNISYSCDHRSSMGLSCKSGIISVD
jgi:hypothetical protein